MSSQPWLKAAGFTALALILVSCGRPESQRSLTELVERSLALVPAAEPWYIQVVALDGLSQPADPAAVGKTMTAVLAADGLVLEPASIGKVGDVLFSDFSDRGLGSSDLFRGAGMRLKIVESDVARRSLEAKLEDLGFEKADLGGTILWECLEECRARELAGVVFLNDRTFAGVLGDAALYAVRGVLAHEKPPNDRARQGVRELSPKVPAGTSMVQASSCAYEGCTASMLYFVRTLESVTSARLFHFASAEEAQGAVGQVEEDERPDQTLDASCTPPTQFAVSRDGLRVESISIWRVPVAPPTPQPVRTPTWLAPLTLC